MTSLRPLSNVFLALSADPTLLDQIERLLRGSSVIDRVDRWDGGVSGCADLPGLPSATWKGDVRGTPARGWFAEGRTQRADGSASSVELALHEPSRLHRVAGDFGFVAVSDGRVAVVRSAAGVVPWLVMQRPELTVISTRNAWFARFLPQPPKPDVVVRAAFSDGGSLPDRRGPWVGTRVVRCGHVWSTDVRDRRPASEIEYWDPLRLTPSRSSSKRVVADAAVGLASALEAVVRADFDPNGSNLIGLSGGIDSSVLAAIASENGLGMRGLSLFDRADLRSTQRNLRFADSIAEFAHITDRVVKCQDDHELLSLSDFAPRVGLDVPHPVLLELCRYSADAMPTVLVGGELADDLFGGPDNLTLDWASAAGPRALWRGLAGSSRWIRPREVASLTARNAARKLRFVKPAGIRLPGLDEAFSADLHAEFDGWLETLQVAVQQWPSHYRDLQLTRLEYDGWLLQNWEVCSELGVRRSVPFIHRSVMEVAYALHPSDHAMPPKRLIRLAMAGRLPDASLWRSDKGLSPVTAQSNSDVVDVAIDGVAECLDPTWLSAHQMKEGRVICSMDSALTLRVFSASLAPVG